MSRSSHTLSLLLAGAAMALVSTPTLAANPVFFGPTPYLSTADIPLGFYAGGSPTMLDNLEDGSLDASVVGSGGGSVLANGFPGIRDSVDADDGVINGTCGPQTSATGCGSWFNGNGEAGATFTFAGSGALPTAFGLVWTDGFGVVTFSATAANGGILGIFNASDFPDRFSSATTGDDRFFGVQFAGGIRSITISNSSGGIEVDHIQYGQMAAAVPEPETYAMLLAGLGLMGVIARRKQRAQQRSVYNA